MTKFSIFLNGYEGKTRIINGLTAETTIAQLKEIIKEFSGIEPADQRLIYTTKELTSHDSKSLKDFEIEMDSNLYLVGRLRGGVQLTLKIRLNDNSNITLELDRSETIKNLKKKIVKVNDQLSVNNMSLYYAGVKLESNKKFEEYKIDDDSMIIQKKGDLSDCPDLIVSYEPDSFTSDDSHEARAKMVCGHVISTESMTMFLRSLISSRKYTINCPGDDKNGNSCGVEWDYNLCKRVGMLSNQEKQEFEKGFAITFISQKLGYKECRVCLSFIEKPPTLNHNRVSCGVCVKKGKAVDFCWLCLKEWKNSQNDHCGNTFCGSKKEIVALLQNCRCIKNFFLEGVPNSRACPECNTLIEHNKGCKHMKCVSCKKEFCFVCLSVKKNEEWPCGKHDDKCRIAPRQTEKDFK